MPELIIPNFNFGIVPIVASVIDTDAGTIFDETIDLGALTDDEVYLYIYIEDKIPAANAIVIQINSITTSTYSTTRITQDTITSPSSNSWYAFSLSDNAEASALYVIRGIGVKSIITPIYILNDNTLSRLMGGNETTSPSGIRYIRVYSSGNAIGRMVVGKVDPLAYTNV